MAYDPFKLYSRRQAEANGEITDVFLYDELSNKFRIQVCHVISKVYKYCIADLQLYNEIEKEFSQRIGEHNLGGNGALTNICNYIETADDLEALDLIDFILYTYNNLSINGNYVYREKYHSAIEQINYWFRYNSLGYEFLNGELIRVDSQLIHQEAVKPALLFLSDPRFAGANQEMLDAYEARRNGDNDNAIVNANKAFESTMKTICTEKQYPFDPQRDAALALINILRTQGFFPTFLDSHITAIRTTLESGLPTVRNRMGGHGQGPTVTTIPDEYVDYALNLAATNITFLARLLINNP